MIGRTLGDRYLVERLLGEGGMGAVYAARQLGLGREVAIKVLRPEIAPGGVEAERFRREALASARLHHPHIVKIYDFGRTPEGEAYLVMELLAGPSLAAWIAGGGRLEPANVADVFEAVGSAVDALHSAGVVHRDIKPANISLPTPDDPDDVVKLIDLGIARFSDSARGKLTGAMIIGTAEYIAPEVATGGIASPASDLYALAITVFEALVGFPPFTGESDREVLIQQIRQEPPRPSRARRGVPIAFDDVFAKALAKDPADRYASGHDLALALRAAALVAATDAPTSRSRPKRSILVVSSDERLRGFVRDCLAAFGYVVAESPDAVDALMKLGGSTFDLVIAADDLTGLDASTFLRLKLDKGMAGPTLLLAASDTATPPIGDGVSASVSLPIDAAGLFAAVSALFAQS